MALQETFRKFDDPHKNRERFDVRKEAKDMVERHQLQLKELREQSASNEAFREAALKATETFKSTLKNFFTEHGQEDLYEEMVGFVSGKVSEIINDQGHEQSR